MLWKPHAVPLRRCNIWRIRGRDRDLLIDTGRGIGSLKEAAEDLLQKKVTAVATHVHADHIGGHHEFDDCIIHRSEAVDLRHATGDYTLMGDEFDPTDLSGIGAPGYEPTTGPMITAIPYAGYDLRSFRIQPAKVTRTVEEGDVVDLGDRSSEVLHISGHSLGSIGLWKKSTWILFSGDSVYDGPSLDDLPGSNIPDIVHTMERLCDLPVRVVHAGHDPSFGRERLIELVDAYLKRRELAS